MIDRFRRVLFLGAHPDDEFGCAGTLARLTEAGASVRVLTFADCADQIPDGFTVDDLTAEWRIACELLGVPREALTLWDVPNRHFPQHRQLIHDAIDQERRKAWQAPYDLVLLPAPSDIHQDHATVAIEGIRVFKHTTVLGYELPMNLVNGSVARGYVRLEQRHVELKVRHAATYRSQAHRPYMAEAFVRGLAVVRGVQANAPAAEALEVVRWIA